MRGDECHRQAKLVPSTRNMSRIKTLEKFMLKVKGFKLQRQNHTRLRDDENRDEGLYNELKEWKPSLGS